MVGLAGSGRRKRVRVQGILVGPRTGSKDARAADPGAPPVEGRPPPGLLGHVGGRSRCSSLSAQQIQGLRTVSPSACGVCGSRDQSLPLTLKPRSCSLCYSLQRTIVQRVGGPRVSHFPAFPIRLIESSSPDIRQPENCRGTVTSTPQFWCLGFPL